MRPDSSPQHGGPDHYEDVRPPAKKVRAWPLRGCGRGAGERLPLWRSELQAGWNRSYAPHHHLRPLGAPAMFQATFTPPRCLMRVCACASGDSMSRRREGGRGGDAAIREAATRSSPQPHLSRCWPMQPDPTLGGASRALVHASMRSTHAQRRRPGRFIAKYWSVSGKITSARAPTAASTVQRRLFYLTQT